MVHYIGLDVSLKQASICVVNELGSVVRDGVVDSDPEAIAAFLRSKAPGAVRIGLEIGPTATWLWSERRPPETTMIASSASPVQTTPRRSRDAALFDFRSLIRDPCEQSHLDDPNAPSAPLLPRVRSAARIPTSWSRVA